MNRGYVGYSMSVNANNAYKSGEMPFSKWTKKDLLDILESEYNIDVSHLKKYKLKTLKEYFLTKTSWHHTSSYFNETDFYGINEDMLTNIDYDKLNELEADNSKKEPKKELEKVRVKYGVWTGTRKHPRLDFETEYGIKCGNWIYLEYGKIKADRTHIEIEEVYKKAPRGTAKVFNKILKRLK